MTEVDFYKDIQFATDTTPESDEFPSGAHQRVAQTLVEIITGGEGGRAIGLEGTWGSGKSTVIDFGLSGFRKWNEHNNPKRSVFVFDAWAHQGDPLRRVFLEELITTLAAANVIDGKKWRTELEQLRSKHKRTIETRAENLSWVARIALLTLPLYPLAYGLVAAAVTDKTPPTSIEIPFVGPFSLRSLAFLGAMIISAPYVAALLTWMCWLTKPEMKGKSVIWHFNKQTDHVTTEQLIREEEATTIEFNREFDKLIDDAKWRGHQIIIVLDNLDRLANEQIREIWATMRNFFAAASGSERKETLKNVWLIVPIDRDHIETVFADGGDKTHDHTTRGFVEKTFEIVLTIPPPLGSNWRSFLSRILRQSFKDKITNDDVYRLVRLFELFHTAHPSPITPRAIKTFVNKVVGQAKLSGDVIPLEYQALFVLYKDEIKKAVHKLQDSTILDEIVRSSITDPVWTKYVAAAYFNVPPEEALELLLGPEIEKALLEQTAGRLDALKKTGGFVAILHTLISEKAGVWAKENPAKYLGASAELDKLALDEVATNYVWNDFARGLSKVETPIIATDLSPAGIEALVRRSTTHDRVSVGKNIRRALEIAYPNLNETAQTVGVSWFNLVKALVESLKEKIEPKEYESLANKIPVQASIPFVLGVAQAAFDSKHVRLNNFSITVPRDEITNAIVALIQIPEPPAWLEPIVVSFFFAPKQINWPTLVTAIQTRLQQNSPSSKAQVAVRLLKLLSNISNVQDRKKNSLRQLCDDGSVQGILEIGRREKNEELISFDVFTLLILRDVNVVGPATHPQYGDLASVNEFLRSLQNDPSANSKNVDAIANVALNENSFSEILRMALPPEKNRELFRAILRKMISAPAPKKIDAVDVLTNFQRIKEILGSELIASFLNSFDSVDIGAALESDKWRTIQSSFLDSSREVGIKHYSSAVTAIRIGLGKNSTDEWTGALDTENNDLDLLFKLIELQEIGTLETPFFDALQSHAQKVIESAKLPTKFASRWHQLPGVLSESRRAHFYKWVRDNLVNKAPNAKLLVGVLSLFGKEFSNQAELPERSDDVIRTIIDPLGADGSDESLSCLESHAEPFAKTIAAADTADRQVVIDRLTTAVLKSDPERRPRIENLATLLGIGISGASETDKKKA